MKTLPLPRENSNTEKLGSEIETKIPVLTLQSAALEETLQEWHSSNGESASGETLLSTPSRLLRIDRTQRGEPLLGACQNRKYPARGGPNFCGAHPIRLMPASTPSPLPAEKTRLRWMNRGVRRVLMGMNYRFLLFISVMTGICSSTAHAHFKLLEPPSSLITENGGKGSPPCGDGIPSLTVTKAQGGHPFTIRLLEFVPHPGHYRIALSVNSRADLPKDPEAVANDAKISVSASIESDPKAPVLIDGAFVHTTTPRNTEWKTDVVLPNLDCTKCTLQVIEFMAEHALNSGGGYYYHHCADLQITADPGLPRADKAWSELLK